MPIDEAGLRPDALRAAVRDEGASLVYLVPTGQNPTGSVMPERRRAEVGAVFEELRLTAVEDGTLHDLTLRASRPHTIAELVPGGADHHGRLPEQAGLGRPAIGWVHGPAELVERLGRLKLAMDHGSPAISQLIGARLLDDADAQRQRARAQLAARVAATAEAMASSCPTGAGGPRRPGSRPGSGYRGRRPPTSPGWPGRWASRWWPGRWSRSGRGFDDHLRLALVHEPAVLREAVARLAEAWSMYVPGGGSDGDDCLV